MHESLKPRPRAQIRYWGVCNETPFGVCELVRACDKLGVPRPVTIQNQFSLLYRSYETSLAELASPAHYDMALLPWSPLVRPAHLSCLHMFKVAFWA